MVRCEKSPDKTLKGKGEFRGRGGEERNGTPTGTKVKVTLMTPSVFSRRCLRG